MTIPRPLPPIEFTLREAAVILDELEIRRAKMATVDREDVAASTAISSAVAKLRAAIAAGRAHGR